MNVKTLKEQRSESTRAALVEAGRRLFADQGFAATSTEDIVRTAGLTRGALYHHFRDKEDLFRAVCQAIDDEVLTRIATAARAAHGAWEHLVAGANAWLDACMEPEIRRILVLDAPAVLGDHWHQGRVLDELRLGLKVAIDAGEIDDQPVEPLAHMLLGAMRQAGFIVAKADDVKTARAEVGVSLDRLLSGLRN